LTARDTDNAEGLQAALFLAAQHLVFSDKDAGSFACRWFLEQGIRLKGCVIVDVPAR
jgi:hypothetical protein